MPVRKLGAPAAAADKPAPKVFAAKLAPQKKAAAAAPTAEDTGGDESDADEKPKKKAPGRPRKVAHARPVARRAIPPLKNLPPLRSAHPHPAAQRIAHVKPCCAASACAASAR